MLTTRKAEIPLNAAGLRFAIVSARYNERFTDSLLAAARDTLAKAHALPESIRVERVPGAFEIPVIAARLAKSGAFDAIIAQGCIIQGETEHARLVAESVAHALQRIAVDTSVPCIFGVVTATNKEQARARCLGKQHNRGAEAARAAIEIACAIRRLKEEGRHGKTT
jgi:6,7-dimethyl-8-ribityllumazine synthase